MEALILILLASVSVVADSDPEYIVVDSKMGKIRGLKQNVLGKKVNAFLGIPYAKPPVGKARFKRPEPIEHWTTTHNATKLPPSCFQVVDQSFGQFSGVNMWNPNTEMSEDCLYLNIWAPEHKPGARPKAVMVWIFGGGFYGGTSTLDLYNGRILAAEKDIVLVSMQYRVGVLGFLYLGTLEAPGNMGLLDQHTALQWIYNYIGDFGGDNKRITLFGESAGAVSVSFHTVSPISQPLFTNAIMQSGSALCRWSMTSREGAIKKTKILAGMVNCSTDASKHEILKCLHTVDPALMTKFMWRVPYNDLVTPISPVVDDYFLQEDPQLSIKHKRFKKCSILLGSNKDEGSYFLVYTMNSLYSIKENQSMSRDDYKTIVGMVAKSDKQLVIDAVEFEYGVPPIFVNKQKYRDILDDMIGDVEFICPVMDYGEAYTEAGNDVYIYRFAHRVSRNPWPKWMGVMHGYEISCVFGVPLNSSQPFTQEEKEFSKRMMTYWTNFAKTGDPNKDEDGPNSPGQVTWPKHDTSSKSFMYLNLSQPSIGYGPRDRQCQFWSDYLPNLRNSIGQETNPGYICVGAASHPQTHIHILISLALFIACLFFIVDFQ